MSAHRKYLLLAGRMSTAGPVNHYFLVLKRNLKLESATALVLFQFVAKLIWFYLFDEPTTVYWFLFTHAGAGCIEVR